MIIDMIRNKTATICILGLGYVGLHVATAFARTGFKTIGIDIDKKKINDITSGLLDIPGSQCSDMRNDNLSVTGDFKSLEYADASIICVPTPLSRGREPDLSPIVSATRQISKYLHREQLVLLESTSYPGTTREVILPILESNGLTVGRDYYLAMSPERIDPSNPVYNIRNTPKLVGGMTRDCTAIARLLYRQICDKVIPVSTPEVAEMAKLLENTFRNINIAFVNEVAMLCDCLNIDIKSAIDAAASKPFGFMRFYPGPGVGGHCIPIDPLYLLWKARSKDFNLRLVELADEINASMPRYAVLKITNKLAQRARPVKDARILIVGITYKRDTNDIRESPALEIMKILQATGANVEYHDPYVPEIKVNDETLTSVKSLEDSLRNSDCVVLATDHSCYDYEWLASNSSLFIDLKLFGQGGLAMARQPETKSPNEQLAGHFPLTGSEIIRNLLLDE